jgi:hypothetical protein
VFLVVLLQQIGCVDIICWLPCVVTLGVSSPLDKVLQGMTAPEVLMIPDGLHLILYLSFDKIWWWLVEVQSMLCCFMIGQ